MTVRRPARLAALPLPLRCRTWSAAVGGQRLGRERAGQVWTAAGTQERGSQVQSGGWAAGAWQRVPRAAGCFALSLERPRLSAARLKPADLLLSWPHRRSASSKQERSRCPEDGSSDERDITVRRLDAVRSCAKEKMYRKKITVSDRGMVEESADQMLREAANADVGDPFRATTHTNLVVCAKVNGD